MQGYKATKTRALERTGMRGAYKLAKMLEAKRAGALVHRLRFRVGDPFWMRSRKPLDIRIHENSDATQMIENFMIAANEVCGKAFCEDDPFVAPHRPPGGEDSGHRLSSAFSYKLEEAILR